MELFENNVETYSLTCWKKSFYEPLYSQLSGFRPFVFVRLYRHVWSNFCYWLGWHILASSTAVRKLCASLHPIMQQTPYHPHTLPTTYFLRNRNWMAASQETLKPVNENSIVK